MMMKQLFKHTTSLLRTALLFGAIAFVNIPQVQAQTPEQLAEMPNAFETIEDPNSVIGNGEYYYIQFYYNGPISYLTDCGVSKKALASDFLPSNNRLWTLESAGNGQFKLKCKDGNYLGFGRFNNQDRYGGVVNSEDAIVFTFGQFNGGYYIKRAASDHVLYRNNNAEWADFPYGDGRDSQKYSGHMRIVKLKSNAAYIIYYRQDGADNSDPSASTIRHYLTYSDVDATSTVMASAVTNGSLEGADASSFFFGDPDHDDPFVASITDGAGNNGSRGIQITARGKASANDWDTQFFISADEVIPEGTTFHLEFDYRASRNATVPTQAHYITEMPNINGIRNLSFTTDWQHYSADIEVSHVMGYGGNNDKGNSFQTIAFNLWRERSTDPNTIYYFDNIKLTVPTSGSAVSSRRSIIPPDKPLTTLPTIAAYHQDGLWQLEEASADGKFYIKKYDSNEYLNCDLADPYAAAFAVLGPKDETHGQYSLVDPVASRYTLVQNVQYQTAALSPDMFHHWNGYGADASIDNPHGNVDFFFQLGQQLNSGDVVAGTGGVDYVRYADLTGYTTMIIKGTPGMVVRVLMNRQESNSGPLTERALTIGNDGKVELDLTAIKNDAGYVHLNAIKIGWGNSGIINDVELVNQNQVNNSSPLYLNHSNGDGYPVMERNDDATNHWYAAFYPVEVPVPNKDDFFQVLVKWGDNMINHNGGASPLPADESDYDLWQLEMVDDYKHFRLKNPSGRYLKPGGTGVTEPNNPDGAETNTNEKFWTDFALTWYFINPVPKEIRVNHYVRHKESYLRAYASAITNQEGLKKQGLAFNDDPEWETTSGDLDGFRQKTNHFEITHYVKRGDSRVIEFPTVLNRNNDHIYFQRFFHYGEVDEQMDLDNLKAHVSLDTRDDGNVQYFLYNNGMVTGQKLDWRTYDNNTETYSDIPDGGMARNEQRRFNFTNSDGESFTVAVDVSRYSDLQYLNTPDHLDGDLREPSLTMRYLFYMNDAKDMAKRLTACSVGSGKWLEEKTFHFGRTQVPYTKFKKVGYRGEFIPVRHVFSDYWVYDDPQLINDTYLASLGLSDDALNDYLNDHLVSAVNDNMTGKIEVEIVDDEDYPTNIRLGGYNPNIDLKGYDDEGDDDDYKGYYLYDLMSRSVKREYGNSRFIVFRYPESGIVNTDKPAFINVYLNNNGTRYQLAQYTIYFDANMATRPWTKLNNGTVYANGVNQVKGTNRDPNQLRARAGHPIAKVTFDYPIGETYHYPNTDSRHDGGDQIIDETGTLHYWVQDDNDQWVEMTRPATINNSSPVPLTFGHTNYAFDGDGCNWGSYALVTQKRTVWGNNKIILPADDEEYGYNIDADPGMQKAFMYIDASEQPGDICAVDFEGEFCASDQLMCSGWISGSNRYDDDGEFRCPGSITITIKGEDVFGNSNTIYRFCPGQIYELDNGYEKPGATQTNTEGVVGNAGVDGRGNGADHVVWQQFFFVFSTDQKYERYWLEVNNNCVSSNGGDFMLDNVEVYTIVPEVEPEINTPLCVTLDEHGNPKTEMRLLKLKVDYNKLKSSATVSSGNAKVGFVFLEKDVFLNELWTRKHLENTYANVDSLASAIKKGKYILPNNDPDLKEAFKKALVGKREKWDSADLTSDPPKPLKKEAGIMYFEWSATFEDDEVQPEYSFDDAVNKKGATFRYTDDEGTQWLIFNGNYPGLPWKTDTDYYIVPTNAPLNDPIQEHQIYENFNICSECSKESVFRINSPYNVLGLESTDATGNYVVCEGQIPTILLDLKGYTLDGKELDMKGLNFDWWLGRKGDNTATPPIPAVLATLENYHKQDNGMAGANKIKLDKALATFRTYYSDVNSLDGLQPNDELTQPMLDYLQSLVDAGELILHQTSVSVPAEPASDKDSYFYLVACPIHDAMFNQALNPEEDEYVSYFCEEPQGLRFKVGQKAPTLKTGFVPGEHGFDTYDYDFPEGTDPVLSIRLAKAAQFETVKNTVEETEGVSADVNYLWLPIRNAQTQTAPGVIRKADDDNIYLASTNDPTWDKQIYTSMSKTGSLPVVGRIVQLEAINTKGETEGTSINLDDQNDLNRLCVYFTENFEVREGYNYTLSLPFEEERDAEGNEVNTCDGTILINLKIVPDYEVWTGAAGNKIPDWNNDENWRRADGNPANSGLNQDELYVAAATADSPLNGYKTNAWNYRTPKDRVFRKGFAPLYCTHVLMMSDEWGNAPVLYDALDYDPDDAQHKFTNAPFPNLRDKDGWDGTTGDNITKATATAILKFDMQARRYDMWNDTYGVDPDRGMSSRPNDLIAEMYQINSCDEIVFQPGTELRNAHLLNYNSAWVEYKLDNRRWYLLGSPLQGTIAGEWYAPTGTAQQKTTYYDPVIFGEGYDRYSPAIYQRSWDKAKAVLYEVGSTYSTGDNPDDEDANAVLGSEDQGAWSAGTWNTAGADEYLDRLGYKPLGGNKANVAIQGIWSNTYNDATVDYTKGGFSVMVMNHLKNNDQSNGKSIIRLPKEDTMYDYYRFSETGAVDGGTDTDLSSVRDALNRAKNRGRLKTDLLLPATTQKTEAEASIYGDKRTYTRIPIKETDLATMMASLQNHTEKVPVGVSDLGFYLVENPFTCGLDMEKFFEENPSLEKKYWLLKAGGQQLVQWATTGWVTPTVAVVTDGDPNDETTYDFAAADGIVAPGQGFFVQAVTPATPPTEPVKTVDIKFTNSMQSQSRYGVESGSRTFTVVVGQAQQMKALKKMIDTDNDGIPDTETDEDETILVDTDGDGIPETEQVVMVPVFEMNGDEYVLDADGNRIPVLVDVTEDVILYNYVQDTTEGHEFTLQAPTRSINALDLGLVITAQRGNTQSSALVIRREGASNDFLPSEDTETFITSDLQNVPTVYTLCGRLATSINSIRDFRCLPLGVESASDAPCTLTFKGVELLGDSVAFYDAVERKLTPLESGMTMTVSGQTQNRYYLVSSLIQEEAAEETHLQIFSKGLTVKVIASTAEPIVSVRCYDVGGSQVHNASPQTPEYSFNLSRAGVYLIKADTENDHKVVKVIVR